MTRRLARFFASLRNRLVNTHSGNDFLDACCHRVGGVLRAGPATSPVHKLDGMNR